MPASAGPFGRIRYRPQQGTAKRAAQGDHLDPSECAAPVISDDLQQLTPLVLQVVTDQDAIEEWNEMVARHHYLSYTQPFGPHLRYYILDQQGRKLGCLLFAAAGSSLACRDTWIDEKHKKQLHLVVNNSRFLILPWVKVKCLASMAPRWRPGNWLMTGLCSTLTGRCWSRPLSI